MTHWYLTFYYIFIFETIIFSNDIPSIFASRIITDQYTIEHSLHDFMVGKNVKILSMENVSSFGKRLIEKFSICGLSRPRKLNLCKRAMVEEDYFVEKFKNPNCKTETFDFTFHFDDIKEDPEISMYRCPDLLRRNPDTGSLEPDNRRLFISRMSSGVEQAMVYKREYEGGKITLERHLVEITKSDLDNPPPPLPPDEIRSINRFKPIRSGRNSARASPSRGSPQYLTAPNSPSQIAQNSPGQVSPTEISTVTSPAHSSISKQSPSGSLHSSPARSSNADKSPRKSFQSGITPSMALGPLVRIPPNVSTETTRHRKKSLMPTSSPLRYKSASGSGSDTAFLTPAQSPLHSRAQTGTQTQLQKRPLSSNTDPYRSISASTSGKSTEDSGVATERVKQMALRSSGFATAPSTGDDASRRAVNISTSKLDAANTRTKAGFSKKMYRHKSFNKDRATRSETSSPQNEDAEFPGFNMIPPRTTLHDSLGNSPNPGSAIQRTQSDNVSGAYVLNQVFPMWPKRQSNSIEDSEEDSKGDSFSDRGPNKSMDPAAPKDIISEWREHRQRMQMKSGVDTENTSKTSAATKEEDASLSPLSKASIRSAYNKNVERHHTDKPTVVSAPMLAYSEEQESSEESTKDEADISSSESLPAMKDFSAQADLSEEYDSSIQTDLRGDEDTPIQEEEEEEEGVSGTVFPAVVTEPSEEAFEEGTTTLSQSGTEISNTPSGPLLSTGNNESIQAAPLHIEDKSDRAIQPATKDQSIQVHPPVKSVVSVGIQVDSHKLGTTTAVPSTSMDILQQTDMSPENTNLMPQTNRDTADQVNKSEEGSKVDPPQEGSDTFTGISKKGAQTLLQAVTEPSEVSSPSTGEKLGVDDTLVLKSTYQLTRPSLEGLRNKSRSAPPPIKSSTIKVEEPEKDTSVLTQTSSGQTYAPATSGNVGPPTVVTQSEYKEPVVVKPVQPQVNISSKSLRRRFRSLSPMGRSAESGDTSPRRGENQSTSSAKDESSSTAHKNEDQPPPTETDITASQNSGILPSEPLGSSHTPSDDSKKKE